MFLITARFQTFQIVTPLSCPCEEGGAAWQLVTRPANTDVFPAEGSDSRIYVCVRRLLVTVIRRQNEIGEYEFSYSRACRVARDTNFGSF